MSEFLDQETKARLLHGHCQEMAANRMRAAITEAIGTTQGWNVSLLCDWKAYNENLVLLMKNTRLLLPF